MCVLRVWSGFTKGLSTQPTGRRRGPNIVGESQTTATTLDTYRSNRHLSMCPSCDGSICFGCVVLLVGESTVSVVCLRVVSTYDSVPRDSLAIVPTLGAASAVSLE